jgi:hypothetical protein
MGPASHFDVLFRACLAGMILTLGTGCLVLPPTRVSVGTGALAVKGRPTEVPLDVRVGLHPMQLDEAALGRRFDFGVGYLRSQSGSSRIDGAYGEATVVLWNRLGDHPFAPRSKAYVRLSLQGQLRVLGERSLPRLGRGVAASMVLETGSFASVFDGPADHEGLFGRIRGATSTGISLARSPNASQTLASRSARVELRCHRPRHSR